MFFSGVRSITKKPTCYQFKQTYKTMLLNDQAKPTIAGTNNEFDLNNSLFSTLKEFIYKDNEPVEKVTPLEQCMLSSQLNLSETVVKHCINMRDITNSVLKDLSCGDCKTCIHSTDFQKNCFARMLFF